MDGQERLKRVRNWVNFRVGSGMPVSSASSPRLGSPRCSIPIPFLLLPHARLGNQPHDSESASFSRHGHFPWRASDRLRLSVCRSPNPKNQRGRCSIALGLPQGNLLIDTPPDLRQQLLREQIGLMHAVTYTHEHADHLFGLDDLRIFANYLGHDLPVYCTEEVERRIRKAYDYAFDDATRHYQAGGLPKLVLQRIDTKPIDILVPASRRFRCNTAAIRCSAFAAAISPIAPTPTAFRIPVVNCSSGWMY